MAKFCSVCKQLVVPTEAGKCPGCDGLLVDKAISPDTSLPGLARATIDPGEPMRTVQPRPSPPPAAPVPTPTTSALAISSLVCGLGAVVITGIPAIITGHLARGAIRRSGGTLRGAGMALAGLILGYMFLALALAALASPLVFKSLTRARMATALDHAREVKSALDDFARDFDGQYPNQDTSQRVSYGGTGSTYSNDYFRQLHLAGCTSSETIFWLSHSSVTGDQPDNDIGPSGKPAKEEILKAGDVHWAYLQDQENRSDARRPIILDSHKNGTGQFDEDLWNGKVIVVYVDGSVKALPMRRTDKRIVDGSGVDLLSPEAEGWEGGGESPSALLTQPEPK